MSVHARVHNHSHKHTNNNNRTKRASKNTKSTTSHFTFAPLQLLTMAIIII